MTDYERIIHRQAIHEAEGYIDLAIGFADQCPPDSELQVRLGQRALNALERLDKDTNDDPHLMYLVGQAYRVMFRYQDAVAPLAEAARCDPENIMIWLALAWCYKRTARLDLAIESLENALAADPREAILHYNLACYWSLAGNAKIALRYLAQSFEIDDSYRLLVADEPDFDPLRDDPDFQSLMGISDPQIH